MSTLNDIKFTFFQECEDLLDALSDGLQKMGGDSCEADTVHAVFRAVHSIKGGAGAFGLSDLVTFSHRFETVLDHVRSDKLAISARVMHVFYRAGDHLSDLITAARDETPSDHDQSARLVDELDALIGGPPVEEDPADIEFEPLAIALAPLEEQIPPRMGGPIRSRYEIGFVPAPELYGSGNDPAMLFRALAKLGTLEVRLHDDDIPPLEGFDWQLAYLRWTLILETSASPTDIAGIFDFVEDVCQLEINLCSERDIEDLPDLMSLIALGGQSTSTKDVSVTDRETLLVAGQKDTEQNISYQSAPPPVPREKTDTGETAPAARTEPAMTSVPDGSKTPATIRVNLDRVDRLINLIGELVIKEAMLSQLIERSGLSANSDVSNGLDGVKQLAGEIQESVMAIRAQPLKPVFQRMQRIVREAASATGKQVRLVTIGEQTEVDKTVIERLVDPLTHMIRNSVDHGLEDTETRRTAGKPAEGTVTLAAAHRSGRIIIEVSDDGGGINRTKVRQLAEDKGLVPAGSTLTAAEIDNLLFMPGFSSKAEVSALSGRGVGLDVVRREIQALGGRVMINSVEGKGTTFSVALPLTLAVLEGMLVELEGQTMVVPITAIQETLRPQSVQIHAIGPTARVVSNRGELIPLIDLGEALDLRPSPGMLESKVLIIVETDSHGRAALIADRISDQRQVVIKSLEDNYGRVPGIAAATILGNGRIALILDTEEIVQPHHGGRMSERVTQHAQETN